VFQNVLEANRDLQAVFACNDLMALGAIEAISAGGRGGSILVVGFDAIDEARGLIREGKMGASIAQYPADMGEVAVVTAARILRGEAVESLIPTRIELITRQNVDDAR
jgi:ribose transport system substrate-binding protein